MKRRREWKVILLGLAVVGFLFLLSSTDLFFEEEREEIYTISVIQDENDSRYQIYRKGIDQAARTENADIYYETASVRNGKTDYEAAARRAQENGAEAILILASLDEEENDWIREINQRTPVLLMGNIRTSVAGYCKIAVDYRTMGGRLAHLLQEDLGEGERVQIFSTQWGNKNVQTACKALMEELSENGIGFRKCSRVSEVQEGSAAVLDLDGMEELLDLKPEGTALYGLGYNDRIAEALAEGQIEGLVLVNEYDMGYQAVYYTIRRLEGKWQETYVEQESISVRPEDAYGKYEYVLFPIG